MDLPQGGWVSADRGINDESDQQPIRPEGTRTREGETRRLEAREEGGARTHRTGETEVSRHFTKANIANGYAAVGNSLKRPRYSGVTGAKDERRRR